MLNGAMAIWFILTGLSLIFVIWDSISNGVTSWVQRAAWILVTAYSGVFGLFFYLLACRRPFVGGHDRYTSATWKQALNSEMHCLAGDATGIMIAAVAVSTISMSNGWDIAVEYLAGFICGLFIFQALMMLGMYQGKYFLAVRKTFFAETVSMNFVMTGMIPVMVLLGHWWPGAGEPSDPAFWFRMSLASVVGGVFAYPINNWLVSRHLKHGCMTLPNADGPAVAVGHRSPEKPMAKMEHSAMRHGSGSVADEGHGSMAMNSLPTSSASAWIVLSFAVLLAALWATSLVAPIHF